MSLQAPKNKFRQKIHSEPFYSGRSVNKQKKTNELRKHSKAFPERYTFAGYLDVRTNTKKSWKRRYFVLSNNFLLCAATEHAEKLERVTPLEGNLLNVATDTVFELTIRKKPIYFRAPNPKQAELWAQHIERAATLKIKDMYRFLYTLGTSESQNTKVVSARHRTTNEECAIKIVDKRLCDQRLLRTEIQILKKLDNPYIVKLYDLFETKKFLYIVMEKCEGGELFDQIAELDGDHYTEKDCCEVMHQIAKGVKYMHEMGIVHRDLKPENILCVKPNSIRKVKLADFGISKMVKGNQQMKTMVGTLSYTAPEIMKGKGYTKSVDYWSLGVIMYILLCGYPPFWGETDQEIQYEVLKQEVEFEKDDWEHVAPETIDLVRGLLMKNPRKRKTADDILQLVWKVSSSKLSFNSSRKKFKETLIKRKMHRMSMGVFEKSSQSMKLFYRDDMSTDTNNIKSSMKYGKNNPFDGKRGSKGTEALMELHLPMSSRDSFILNEEEEEDKKNNKE